MPPEASQAGGLLCAASVHPESPAHARPALPGSHGSLPLQRRLADQRLWLSLCLIHPRPRPFTSGHGPLVHAGQGRSRPVVNSGAQSSKACEGATPPWVQIPPPPPLTKHDAAPQVPALCLPGKLLSQFATERPLCQVRARVSGRRAVPPAPPCPDRPATSAWRRQTDYVRATSAMGIGSHGARASRSIDDHMWPAGTRCGSVTVA
jgi:hypothetical protein